MRAHEGDYAHANGLEMYYEAHGTGVPLILLHGGVGAIELLGGGQADAGWDGSGMSNARLAILPGTTHYDIFSSPALASAVTPFLDAPMPETW